MKKVMPRYGSQEPYEEKQSNIKIKPRYGKKHTVGSVLWKVVAGVALCAIAGAAGLAVHGYSKLESKNVFPVKTYINGEDVSEMTYDAALAKADAYIAEDEKKYALEVVFSDGTEALDAEDLGITYNEDEILADAFTAERETNVFELVKTGLGNTEGIAPLEYTITSEISEEGIKNIAKALAEKHEKAPVNAEVTYDKSSRTFNISKSEAGIEIDEEKLAEDISAALERQDAKKITAEETAVEPEISEQTAKENLSLIGNCTTEVGGTDDRKTNVRLMCEAVDGLCIQPGETLSINELVGERTAEKGFKSAPAIIDGKNTEDQIGGGICQLAGTLYNAALKADMEIVERCKHSYPSAYLPVGLDATLNWNDKDLKIKNKSDMPLYISAYMENDMCTVKIYGKPLEYETEIISEILREIKPESTKYETVSTLEPGETKVITKSRTGYETKVIRRYLDDKGNTVREEIISEDYYKEIQGYVQQGITVEETDPNTEK